MSDDKPTPEELDRRRKWFYRYVNELENHSIIQPAQPGVMYACPCCKYMTLTERGGYDICPVCFWEDDGQDDHDADNIRGGSNGKLSLNQARKNYREFGTSEQRRLKLVRPPTRKERPGTSTGNKG